MTVGISYPGGASPGERFEMQIGKFGVDLTLMRQTARKRV